MERAHGKRRQYVKIMIVSIRDVKVMMKEESRGLEILRRRD